MMRPPDDLYRLLAGGSPLPAGFVPLAHVIRLGLVGRMPDRWAAWRRCRICDVDQAEAQVAAMSVAVAALGGTSASAAERLDVSPRTVEAWRSGAASVTPANAYRIARAMAVAQD